MTKRARPGPVESYIDSTQEPARTRLRALAEAIRAVAPDATERIAWGLATWHRGEHLIHLGAFKHHVGIYPGPAAIVAFADQLSAFKTSKGAIQVPHGARLPLALVRRITRWRLQQAAQEAANEGPKRRPAARATRRARPLPEDIAAYNAALSDRERATCAALAGHVTAALPEAEGKVWHGHPVWFLEGNPVVGYSTHKGTTRLLFWSGQSFDEPGLSPVGKFKAAEARFSPAGDIDPRALRRWLAKSRSVQWDYKNVAKRKGVLERLR
jgi:uncharacterized protein YdhG (YjbR/CyaY superfamily)